MSTSEIDIELKLIFGEELLDEVLARSCAYFLRRLDRQKFQMASEGLRVRFGPERRRFFHQLDSVTRGALIYSLLRPAEWNQAVLDDQVRALPKRRKKRAPRPSETSAVPEIGEGGDEDLEATETAPELVRPVRRRRIRSRRRRHPFTSKKED